MKTCKIFIVMAFLSLAVPSSTETAGQVYGLAINADRVKSNWQEGTRILYRLDSNRTLNSSTARGVLGLRTGSTEFSAYFRGNQICSILAFDDVAISVTSGSQSYAACVNQYSAVKVNRTAEPVSTYSFFKGCFRKIYNIRTNQYKSSSDGRNCSCLFETDMKDYVLQRVNVTLKEEIRVRKCANMVIEEFLATLNTTIQNYKICTGEDFTTVSSTLGTTVKPTDKPTTTGPTSEISTVPPNFDVIEAAIGRFQESFSASIENAHSTVDDTMVTVRDSLSQVKSINITLQIVSLENIAKQTGALMRSASGSSNGTNTTSNCALLDGELSNYFKRASSAVYDCISNATTHLNSLLDTATAIEARLAAALEANGTSAIRRCAISLYSMPNEAVRCCTEDVLKRFSIYMAKESVIDIDEAVASANSARGATKLAKKCLETNYAEFTRQAFVVYQSFKSCIENAKSTSNS